MRKSISVAAAGRFRSLPLTAIACLLLLFAQSATLAHNHDGDTQVRYDCDICLIPGAGTDLAVSHFTHIPVIPFQHGWLDGERESPFLPVLDLRSRAPPQA